LRSLGEGAALASACPKVADGNAAAAAYGYNPAMDAVVDALAQSLAPTDCLAEALPVDDDGRVACTLLEVRENVDCSDYPNRDDATSEDASAVRADLEALGVCRGSACDDLGVCELQQLSGRALERCQNDPEESDDGYCYVDPGQGVGSESLVDACPSGQSRRLRRVASASSGPAEFLMLRCD
jgi:hypothetical protein